MEQKQTVNLTTIKLEQEQTLSGETWYYLYVNEKVVKAFLASDSDPDKALKEATNMYNVLLSRLDAGYPKREILFSATREDKDDN
jgi:hypothetical protein